MGKICDLLQESSFFSFNVLKKSSVFHRQIHLIFDISIKRRLTCLELLWVHILLNVPSLTLSPIAILQINISQDFPRQGKNPQEVEITILSICAIEELRGVEIEAIVEGLDAPDPLIEQIDVDHLTLLETGNGIIADNLLHIIIPGNRKVPWNGVITIRLPPRLIPV